MSRSSKHGSSGGVAGWILPVFMLLIFPPVGILMLVVKLFNMPKNNASRSRHPYYAQKEEQEREPLGARTTMGSVQTQAAPAEGGKKKAAFARNDQLDKLDSMGKRLVIIGSIISIMFLIASASNLSEALYWAINDEVDWFLEELAEMLPFLCFLGGGLGVLWVGLGKRKRARRFRRYMAMIGKRRSMSLEALASASGHSMKVVQKDLEEMFELELFPTGYLDYSSSSLVLSGEGIREEPLKQEPAPKQKAEEKKEHPEDSILAEIKAVNDAIQNQKLSAQIDRIGIITAKILDFQRSHPDKSPQLHSFLSYYLPTTLKILRAYAQLEDQGVAGENITAAMDRIESMMDKVVEGFEKQLDMLFQGDAMDITTDVDVLERMLAKDGLNDDGISLKL